jgi:hypothetical protein
MNLPDTVLDAAYAVFEEWGPRRRIPRNERLAKRFPMLTAEEIAWLLGCMDEVSKTVWNIAEHGGEAKLGATRVTERLQERHPFLHGAGLRQAVFLVNYYAWHEGYDQ